MVAFKTPYGVFGSSEQYPGLHRLEDFDSDPFWLTHTVSILADGTLSVDESGGLTHKRVEAIAEHVLLHTIEKPLKSRVAFYERLVRVEFYEQRTKWGCRFPVSFPVNIHVHDEQSIKDQTNIDWNKPKKRIQSTWESLRTSEYFQTIVGENCEECTWAYLPVYCLPKTTPEIFENYFSGFEEWAEFNRHYRCLYEGITPEILKNCLSDGSLDFNKIGPACRFADFLIDPKGKQRYCKAFVNSVIQYLATNISKDLQPGNANTRCLELIQGIAQQLEDVEGEGKSWIFSKVFIYWWEFYVFGGCPNSWKTYIEALDAFPYLKDLLTKINLSLNLFRNNIIRCQETIDFLAKYFPKVDCLRLMDSPSHIDCYGYETNFYGNLTLPAGWIASLQELELSGWSGATFSFLAYLPNLRSLSLQGCQHCVLPPADMPQLTALVLQSCPGLTSLSINMPQLTTLSLCFCEDLKAFSGTLSNLQDLSIIAHYQENNRDNYNSICSLLSNSLSLTSFRLSITNQSSSPIILPENLSVQTASVNIQNIFSLHPIETWRQLRELTVNMDPVTFSQLKLDENELILNGCKSLTKFSVCMLPSSAVSLLTNKISKLHKEVIVKSRCQNSSYFKWRLWFEAGMPQHHPDFGGNVIEISYTSKDPYIHQLIEVTGRRMKHLGTSLFTSGEEAAFRTFNISYPQITAEEKRTLWEKLPVSLQNFIKRCIWAAHSSNSPDPDYAGNLLKSNIEDPVLALVLDKINAVLAKQEDIFF